MLSAAEQLIFICMYCNLFGWNSLTYYQKPWIINQSLIICKFFGASSQNSLNGFVKCADLFPKWKPFLFKWCTIANPGADLGIFIWWGCKNIIARKACKNFVMSLWRHYIGISGVARVWRTVALHKIIVLSNTKSWLYTECSHTFLYTSATPLFMG